LRGEPSAGGNIDSYVENPAGRDGWRSGWEWKALPKSSVTGSVSALDSYITHLTVERRLAANSIESYARDLNEFAAGEDGQSKR